MAYLLFITRPPHFASRIRRRIGLESWVELTQVDATLARGELPGHVEFTPAEGHPTALLLHKDGNIICANPDEPTVEKMIALAGALDAVVQGEDGEIYASATECPYLVQFALFERVSRRLRVRFPTAAPPGRWFWDAASLVMTPIEVTAADLQAADGAMAGRRRMPVGFPGQGRRPSPGIVALLNPLRPVGS